MLGGGETPENRGGVDILFSCEIEEAAGGGRGGLPPRLLWPTGAGVQRRSLLEKGDIPCARK